MNRNKELTICFVLGIAMIWSFGVLFADHFNSLSQLQGSVTCDCEECGNTSKIVYECLHTSSPPDPNGDPPEPNDWSGTACSKEYCVINTDYYAECPEEPNAGSCPYRIDPNLYIIKQELMNDAPDDCNTPDYSLVEYVRTDCRPWSGKYWCVVSTACPGTLIPPTFYQMYRNFSRTVCDL